MTLLVPNRIVRKCLCLRRLLTIPEVLSVAVGLSLVLLVAQLLLFRYGLQDVAKNRKDSSACGHKLNTPRSFEERRGQPSPPRMYDRQHRFRFHTTIGSKNKVSLDPFDDHFRATAIDSDSLYIYSAFHDNRTARRNPVITVSLIASSSFRKKSPRNLRCLLKGEGGAAVKVSVTVKVHSEHFRLPYMSYFLFCHLPEQEIHDYKKVSVVSSNHSIDEAPDHFAGIVSFPSKDPPKRSLAVCVKPLHNDWNRSLWLVEFIEFYKLLGASHFVFYNHTMGPDVRTVLMHYVSHGEATILRWNLPVASKKEIRTEGIFTALNDCNLRLVNRFELAAMVDIDEFLLPRKGRLNLIKTLAQVEVDRDHTEMVGKQPKIGTFVMANVFFYLYWKNDTTVLNSDVAGRVFTNFSSSESYMRPYLLTQAKTRRLRMVHSHNVRSKYVTRPAAALLLGNHRVWIHLKGYKSYNVAKDVALSQHYRICEYGGFDCLTLPSSVDRNGQRWAPKLLPNVASACAEIFRDALCPEAPPLGSPW